MAKYTLWQFNIAIENGPFIVDLSIKDGDFPVRYVSLPEGIPSSIPHVSW